MEKISLSQIIFQQEKQLNADEFIDILIRSGLAARRPAEDKERIVKMVKNAGIIITARHKNLLVGVARSVSDMVYCTYLSDLAVDQGYQRMGIGKELIRETKLAAPQAKLILLSAPAAIDYYPLIGMKKYDHCYFLDDIQSLI